MISAIDLFDLARASGFAFFTGVPCASLAPLIDCARASPDVRYIGATGEGEAVSIAAGAALAGKRAVTLLQNSGLGNAVNPLVSLHSLFEIPILLLMEWRGQPGEQSDEPQHSLMGSITTRVLDLLDIPWTRCPRDRAEAAWVLTRAATVIDNGRSFAVLVPRGRITSLEPPSTLSRARSEGISITRNSVEPVATRSEAVQSIRRWSTERVGLIATTGFTARALYLAGDRPNHFYMVGSMGCSSSLGLGIALSTPEIRTVVIDGDGAILMRLGTMATLGELAPPNLVHIVLDNGMHESTGGQPTSTSSTDLAAVARACGYPVVVSVSELQQLDEILTNPSEQLTILHVRTRPDASESLPRPHIHPRDNAIRFREWLASTRAVASSRSGS